MYGKKNVVKVMNSFMVRDRGGVGLELVVGLQIGVGVEWGIGLGLGMGLGWG